MDFEIIVTENFKYEAKQLAKKYSSLKADIEKLIIALEKAKAKGKSGGSRVITCVKIIQQSVFLLSIYDKSEKETLVDKELDKLLGLAGLS